MAKKKEETGETVTVKRTHRSRVSENVFQPWTLLSCGHEIPMDAIRLKYCPECGRRVGNR